MSSLALALPKAFSVAQLNKNTPQLLYIPISILCIKTCSGLLGRRFQHSELARPPYLSCFSWVVSGLSLFLTSWKVHTQASAGGCQVYGYPLGQFKYNTVTVGTRRKHQQQQPPRILALSLRSSIWSFDLRHQSASQYGSDFANLFPKPKLLKVHKSV